MVLFPRAGSIHTVLKSLHQAFGELAKKKIGAKRFKRNCLAILNHVESQHEAMVITKHGKPVAKLMPMEDRKDEIFGFFPGKGKIAGDAVSPALTLEESGNLA